VVSFLYFRVGEVDSNYFGERVPSCQFSGNLLLRAWFPVKSFFTNRATGYAASVGNKSV
jgi:hypothetical protein